jgi:hypothetical protein
MPDTHPLRQFLVLVFALLLPSFAVWTFASAALALPAIGFGNIILTGWLPDVVQALAPRGPEAVLVTRFGELEGRHVPAQQAGEALAFVLNTRILSYSIPFYTALHFALARDQVWGRYFTGFVLLYGLLVAGLVSLALKDLMVNLGTTFLDHPSAVLPHPNIIALLYQLNVLIVPTLAPILIWGWQNREAPLFNALRDLPRGGGEGGR